MRASFFGHSSTLALMALGSLVQLCGCNQTSGYVMNESGKAYYAQGNYLAARREFERAMMDSPENANYAFNVGSAMRKQGDLIGAERMYRRAIELDPEHQPAHHEIATLLRDQGRHDEADAHIEEWAATQPYVPEAHLEHAWIQRERGDLAAAEQSLQTALRQKPNHARAMAQLGQVYQESGRSQQAQQLYERSLAINPFQAEVRSRATSMNAPPYGGSPYLSAYAPPSTGAPMMAASPPPMMAQGAMPMHTPGFAGPDMAIPQPHALGPQGPVMTYAAAPQTMLPAGAQHVAPTGPSMSPIQQVGYVQAPTGGAPLNAPSGPMVGYPGSVPTAPSQYPLTMSNATPMVSPF